MEIETLKNVTSLDGVDQSKQIEGKILGVTEVKQELKCGSCNRKAVFEEDNVRCGSCGLLIQIIKAIVSWVIKIIVVTTDKEHYRLTMIGNVTEKFIEDFSTLNLKECSKNEIEKFILTIDIEFTIEFDTNNILGKIEKL